MQLYFNVCVAGAHILYHKFTKSVHYLCAHQSNYSISKKVIQSTHNYTNKIECKNMLKFVHISESSKVNLKKENTTIKDLATWLRQCQRGEWEKLLHTSHYNLESLQYILDLISFVLGAYLVRYTFQLLSLDFTELNQSIGMYTFCIG